MSRPHPSRDFDGKIVIWSSSVGDQVWEKFLRWVIDIDGSGVLSPAVRLQGEFATKFALGGYTSFNGFFRLASKVRLVFGRCLFLRITADLSWYSATRVPYDGKVSCSSLTVAASSCEQLVLHILGE